MDDRERVEILRRYSEHAIRFAAVARKVDASHGGGAVPAPARAFEVDSDEQLTSRQLEVLQLIAAGCANGEISRRLSVSSETAKSHVRALLMRLGAKSRSHAVAISFRRGLLA